jgi:hypothetical protein
MADENLGKKVGSEYTAWLGRQAGRVLGEASGVPGGGEVGEKIGDEAGRAAGEYLYGAPPEVAEILAREHFGRRCGR